MDRHVAAASRENRRARNRRTPYVYPESQQPTLTSVKKAISATLNNLFRNLSVVRNQIVHGASAGQDSHGRTQVILGAWLLKAFIPCFRDAIKANIHEDWGEPPYPRVGSGPDDKCPPPWLS